MKIHSILQKIEPYHSGSIPLNDNYVFYNNIPELSDYLCHPNLNFDLDTIEKNLIHKNCPNNNRRDFFSNSQNYKGYFNELV